ncbi:hypothetical protein N3K66_003608 [Trichothecium roseum]|uniref:Uncharacterized protein n=1 Tax=Trichothecium roseum TaxID=47278 RepID=A0ACC0V787_9HYPO|nr:hypothetical protein N3K66_003608 [Trichothecium roseum]
MASSSSREKTYFEQQREAYLADIAVSFEHVLANINKLNRSLEAVITVGNEFSSVEALWSQFENVMGKPEEGQDDDDDNDGSKAGDGDNDDDGGNDGGDYDDTDTSIKREGD